MASLKVASGTMPGHASPASRVRWRCCPNNPAQASAKFLSEPNENSFGPPDVAQPVCGFVLHHFTYELRAMLTKPGEGIVEILYSEHDA